MNSNEEYIPIIIESLMFGKNSDYPLYVISGKNFILYRSKALVFTENDVLRLKNNGVQHLYIKTHDREKYENDLSEHMGNISESKDMNFEEKAVKTYIFAKVYATTVLTTGNIQDNKEHIKKSVESTMDYLLMSDFAFMNILNLSSYDSNEVSHGINVSLYSMSLANRLGFTNSLALYEIGLSGLLHDIGKTKVRKELLSKISLTETEAEEIRMHPVYSKEILSNGRLENNMVINAVEEHHEASDGSGYPFGKMEENISVYGKIIIIANKFDSLTRNRPYRIKMSMRDALNQMNVNSNLYNSAFLREFTLLMSKQKGLSQS